MLITTAACEPLPTQPQPGAESPEPGSAIVVCGQRFDIGATVVLWSDHQGYDAYHTQTSESGKHVLRYGIRGREHGVSLQDVAQHHVDLRSLRQTVDQVVIHYDSCGLSRVCFDVLHHQRKLSAHFLLDLDGTIYQTLDLKERAAHATIANDRSIGIEIAHIGAYATSTPGMLTPMDTWYRRDFPDRGDMFIFIPLRFGNGGIRTPSFVARPARNQVIVGEVQGLSLRQYDFTPQQYEALAKLTAGLCRVFPKLRCDYPRDRAGQLVTRKLSDAEFRQFSGILGHYHVQSNKIDPGPAFDWDRLIHAAQQRMARD